MHIRSYILCTRKSYRGYKIGCCTGLTLAGYNWEVGRGVMQQWWADWVAERADGRCGLLLVLLSCLKKMAIWRVEWGCKRNSILWGCRGVPSHKRASVHNNFEIGHLILKLKENVCGYMLRYISSI